MSEPVRKRELGRGERVLAGLWRLRLPLPWPGIPHCNAWAIKSGDGIVLVDCGMHTDDSMEQLERAMEMVGLSVDDVRLLVCTHAHVDHYGQAGTIVDRTGCELWMHPNHDHATRTLEDPEHTFQRRLEIGRQSGVPELVLRRYAEMSKGRDPGVARVVIPDLALLPGIEVETDLGFWRVVETPGHAPSHVCLYQPERRILISGDHLLGRISLYYDYGWTPDPVGEFLRSLDAIEALDPLPRLCLAGHARPFTDVEAHIEANRELVAQRVAAAAVAIEGAPLTAYEVVPYIYGDDQLHAAAWLLVETLCYLRHLEAIGAARREPGDPERWVAV
ncbi:MAG TPA: MBL fold metallo-hydrolase [Conexibacter sp.]|jgi:glyoxylase-like metal-dependent hydrolase (beta-lactamase superfamily II)